MIEEESLCLKSVVFILSHILEDRYGAGPEALGPADIVMLQKLEQKTAVSLCRHSKEKDKKLTSARTVLNTVYRGITLYIFVK